VVGEESRAAGGWWRKNRAKIVCVGEILDYKKI